MSADPAALLQAALARRLTQDLAVRALVAGRVFDRVPPRPSFPYVTLGDVEVIDDGHSCGEASEVVLTVHGWSRAVGAIEVKRLGAAIRAALAAPLEIDGHAVVEQTHRSTRYVRDPDGLTEHAIVQIVLLTEPD